MPDGEPVYVPRVAHAGKSPKAHDAEDRRQIGRGLVHALRNRLASVKLAVQTVDLGEQLGERSRKRLSVAQREIRELELLFDQLAAFVDA